MKQIESFLVDHRTLLPGVYISRIDEDVVTYDLRFCRPNTGELLSNSEMHSVEHLFATFIRNSSIAEQVLYFGPMGCQTGFYLLLRDTVKPEKALDAIRGTLDAILSYDGEVFGNSERECGNYRSLNLAAAKAVCGPFLDRIRTQPGVKTYQEL